MAGFWCAMVTFAAHAHFVEMSCSHSLTVHEYTMLCSTSSVFKNDTSQLNWRLVSLNTAHYSALCLFLKGLSLSGGNQSQRDCHWKPSDWIAHRSSYVAPPPYYNPHLYQTWEEQLSGSFQVCSPWTQRPPQARNPIRISGIPWLLIPENRNAEKWWLWIRIIILSHGGFNCIFPLACDWLAATLRGRRLARCLPYSRAIMSRAGVSQTSPPAPAPLPPNSPWQGCDFGNWTPRGSPGAPHHLRLSRASVCR